MLTSRGIIQRTATWTVSVMSVSTSEASITREGQNQEQEGTFDHHLN